MADFQKVVDSNFLHWLAGFFEGEGSCGCYLSQKNKKGKYKTYKLQASISQKDRRILDDIKEKIGCGWISKNEYSYGKVWHWRCDSANGRHFLNLILPYMRTPHKKKQVLSALEKDAKKVSPKNTRPGIHNRVMVQVSNGVL